MKILHDIIVSMLLCGILLTTPGAVCAAMDGEGAPAAAPQGKAAPAPNEIVADDSDPGMGFALLIVILMLVCFVLVVIAVVAAITALGLVTVLVAVGIVSSSMLVGFTKRRPSAGLRVFFIQVGAVVGIPCGVAISLLVVWLFGLDVGLKWPSIGGAGCGLLAGVGIAIIFNAAWGHAARWFRLALG